MQPLEYRNLLLNKCPKCRKTLWFNKSEEMIMCTLRCGFMIHKVKMEAICVDIISKRIGKYYTGDNSLS